MAPSKLVAVMMDSTGPHVSYFMTIDSAVASITVGATNCCTKYLQDQPLVVHAAPILFALHHRTKTTSENLESRRMKENVSHQRLRKVRL